MKLELNKVYNEECLEFMQTLPDNYIDLIYCDILYNTRKKFKDFSDNLGSTEQAIEWYRPRLEQMKRIMKETASIYIHCDWRLAHYLKVEMDRLFGEGNFRNHIVWCYGAGGSKKDRFATKHDDILFYSKTEKATWNQLHDDKTKAKLKDYWLIKSIADKSGCLRYDDPEVVLYNTQKPKELLERIIKASSNEGDVIADFFLGSGTTVAVAKELGRRFIGCDINPKAIEITERRLNGVIAQSRYTVQ